MTPYYAANPGIRTQNLATLFPFLEGMLPFLVRNDSGSPFSGAVTKANTHTKPPRNRPNRRANRSPKPAKQCTPPCTGVPYHYPLESSRPCGNVSGIHFILRT